MRNIEVAQLKQITAPASEVNSCGVGGVPLPEGEGCEKVPDRIEKELPLR